MDIENIPEKAGGLSPDVWPPPVHTQREISVPGVRITIVDDRLFCDCYGLKRRVNYIAPILIVTYLIWSFIVGLAASLFQPQFALLYLSWPCSFPSR